MDRIFKISQIVALLLFVTNFTVSVSIAGDKEIDNYTAAVREKITLNWTKQKPENIKAIQESKSSIAVMFSFEIKRDGTIQKLKITESSKVKEIDDKALNAVKLSAPFMPLPKGLDILTVGYGFKFEPPVVSKKLEVKQKALPDESTYKEILDSYYKSVIDKISSNWKKPDVLLNDTTRVVVGFEVNKDGSVKDLKVVEGSDFPELDESGLNAVKISSPFPPIPEVIPFDSISIKHAFALDTVAVYDVNSPLLTQVEKTNIGEETKKSQEAIKKYHDEISDKINKLWTPPQDKYYALRTNQVEVEFSVLKSGELYRPAITTSSGDWELDQSAIQTIEHAAPFSSFSPDIKQETLKFTHKFLLKQDF